MGQVRMLKTKKVPHHWTLPSKQVINAIMWFGDDDAILRANYVRRVPFKFTGLRISVT